VVDRAFDALLRDVDRFAARAGPRIRHWLDALSPTGKGVDRFTHRCAFPTLALPWWAESSICGTVDLELQHDLIRSSLAGYAFIRLLDDVMDRDPRAEPSLLPAAGVLHTLFEAPYHARFEPGSPFWDHFRKAWGESAEAAIVEAEQTTLDESAFHALSARKFAAVEIPLAASCLSHRRPDAIDGWFQLARIIGRHEQTIDDLLDWMRDQDAGRPSYLLSEAHRESGRHPGGATGWIVSHGLEWAFARMKTYREEARALARELRSLEAQEWLDDRESLVEEIGSELRPGLESLGRLSRMFAVAGFDDGVLVNN
jgi:hypothetical protein